jgi:hypothetical protein
VNERDWQSRVVGYARLRGWLVNHARPARTAGGWRTPVQGDPGFPDLALARGGRLILAELKTGPGRLTAGQSAWIEALPLSTAEVETHVWRPGRLAPGDGGFAVSAVAPAGPCGHWDGHAVCGQPATRRHLAGPRRVRGALDADGAAGSGQRQAGHAARDRPATPPDEDRRNSA